MNNINQIKERLKAFKDQLEVDYKPLKIRYIKLETSTNHKLSLIENNKALVQRLPQDDDKGIDLYRQRPGAYQKDLEDLKALLNMAHEKCKLINKRLVENRNYEKVVELKVFQKQLSVIVKLFNK